MRIGIIGAGAIGCLFGAYLSLSGNNVLMVHHDPKIVATIRHRGLELHRGKEIVRANVRAEQTPANLLDRDLVLVAVKAYDTLKVAQLHRNNLKPASQLVTLQNGLGNLETLGRIFRKQSILVGLTTEASLSLGVGRVMHTGKGDTRLGRADGKITRNVLSIVREFRNAGLRCVSTKNTRGAIWGKAIVNAAINPVSAITGLPNGELANLEPLKKIMMGVIREGILVCKAEGETPTPEPQGFLFRILKDTSQNRSSMLQDIQRGKRTEILQLNGAIAGLGIKHAISTPANSILTSLILGLEFSKSHSTLMRGKHH